MQKLKDLQSQLASTKLASAQQESEIKNQIKAIYFAQFNDWAKLQKAISRLESGGETLEYCVDEFGDICAYVDFPVELDQLETESLESYLTDMGFYLDAENGLIKAWLGECLVIQEQSTKNNNGVWDTYRLVIEESQYLGEDGEVDETKRNELIESYMEKTGFYPGVFRVTRNGDAYFVNTVN